MNPDLTTPSAKEYLSLKSISGPLLVLEGVKGVGYDESGSTVSVLVFRVAGAEAGNVLEVMRDFVYGSRDVPVTFTESTVAGKTVFSAPEAATTASLAARASNRFGAGPPERTGPWVFTVASASDRYC